MKIAIDARMLGWTGIGRYTKNLIAHLAEIDHDNCYELYLLPKDFDRLEVTNPNFTKVLAPFRPYSISEQLGFYRLLKSRKPDLVHFVSYNAPVLYRGRRITTIPDLTLLDFKNLRSGPLARLTYETRYAANKFALSQAVRHSSALTTYTAWTKQQLGTRFSTGTLNKAFAIHLGVDEFNGTLASKKPSYINTSERFLLYAGNAYPNKNLKKLLEAFRRLAANNTKLIMVGGDDYFMQQIQMTGAGLENVLFPGFVPDDELRWLYQNAALFVFPSLSEGFGLPPLEAMAAGCPAISSNASCMPEVLGDAAAYFDPKDPQDMANKIQALLNNPEELTRLRKAGLEQVKKYSWRKMAEETLAVYKEVLGQ